MLSFTPSHHEEDKNMRKHSATGGTDKNTLYGAVVTVISAVNGKDGGKMIISLQHCWRNMTHCRRTELLLVHTLNTNKQN